jgi:serine protease AprX
MKYKTVIVLLLFLAVDVTFAQNNVDCIIYFNAKNNNTYSLIQPEKFLTKASIERREKQNVKIDETDLPVNEQYLQALKNLNVEIKNTSRWLNAVWAKDVSTVQLAQIEQLAFVSHIEKHLNSNQKVQTKFEIEKEDNQPVNNKSTKSAQDVFNYGASQFQAQQINVNCLHNLGFTGKNITIAVLDAGFLNVNTLQAFDSLLMTNRLLGTRDFVTGDTLVFEDFPHGMNVLSCMTGNLPGQIVGTAPHAKFWLLRTEDADTETIQEEFNWVVGAEFADSVGADVINSSLGYSYFDNSADNHTYADMDGNTTIVSKAAVWAARKGILVVSSAGNSGGSPWYKITAPADADSIITVGAVDLAGDIGSFSSRGPTYDGRIKPTTVACGVNSVIASQTGGITTSSGTSFSSPITAGAVACLWQAHPLLTNIEIMNAIIQSASQYSTPDTIKGFGIPDFCLAHSILTTIEEQKTSNQHLIVYPNPFHNYFQVNFYSSKKEIIELILYDVFGRQVFSRNQSTEPNQSNSFSIDGIDVSNGIYFLQVKNSSNTKTLKLVKN